MPQVPHWDRAYLLESAWIHHSPLYIVTTVPHHTAGFFFFFLHGYKQAEQGRRDCFATQINVLCPLTETQ